MISRRNIRVKVMQTLYTAATREKELTTADAEKILGQHFSQTRSLFIYFLYFISELAHYAEKDARHRASKHLRTNADLHVSTKIAENEILQKILENADLKKQFKESKPESKIDTELVRKLYHHLAETVEYRNYISQGERVKTEEKHILEFMLDELLSSEAFTAHLEENFSNWEDDSELMVQILTAVLEKPSSLAPAELLPSDKKEFAFGLLRTVLEKDAYLQGMIVPKLKNWDPERIALLDMILMKMGVAEFLYFETIPPKVTINEYIDLAKEYSTQQSGQFVNGILDNIHKELLAQGKLAKVEYKKR
jgi:transcription antitermination protein NusB